MANNDGRSVQYFGMDRPLLPYKTYTSPVDETPHFIAGSINILGSEIGYLQKRPGFSDALEAALSAIPGTVNRMYGWRRWAGSVTNASAFFVMASVRAQSGASQVWKYQIGSDASFVLLWDETNPVLGATALQPITGVPFDFADSNNSVFFGNASSRTNMRKFDGVTCSLWGIDPPPSAPVFTLVGGVLPAGLSLDPNSGVLSGTPTVANYTSLTATVTDAAGATSSQTLNLSIASAGLQWTTTAGALPVAVQGAAYSQQLAVQSGTKPYTFKLYSGTLPAGITLSTTGFLSGTPSAPGSAGFAISVMDSTSPTPAMVIRSFTLFVGSSALTLSPATLQDGMAGSAYSETMNPSGGTAPYTLAFVGGAIPSGMSFTSTTSTAGNPPVTSTSYQLVGTPTTAGKYAVTVRLTDSASNVTEFNYSLNIAASSLTITTSALPDAQIGVPYSQAIAVSGGTSPYSFTYNAGAMTAQTGYVYGYTYTSTYGHESAMGPLSANTGLFTDQDIGVDLIGSSDPQVTGINVYRSTDGGDQTPAVMRLVASLGNATESYLDATPDIYLGNQTGPALYVNDPPQPLRGFKWSNGRIWGFNQQATWFTGNEEVTNGVPVECMSDAKNGNFYQWPSEVFSLEVTDNGVDIALSEEFWQVSGDTLDTFRKSRLLRGGGTLSPTCTCTVGNTVYWIDTAKQVFSSDKGEIGLTIRTDLQSIVHAQTYILYHKFGTRNWLCVFDGANGKLLLYDMDTDTWLVPWAVAGACLASGQTASGVISLLMAFPSGHVRVLSTATYNDDGTLYGEQMRTNLFPVVPGARTTARNTAQLRKPDQLEMELDTQLAADGVTYVPSLPDQAFVLTDDDPTQTDLTLWRELFSQPLQFGAEYHRYIMARRWRMDDAASCRRLALAAVWNPSAVPWKLYTFDFTYVVS